MKYIWIKELIGEKRGAKSAFAKACGLKTDELSKIFSGVRSLHLDEAIEMSRVLDKSVEWVRTGQESLKKDELNEKSGPIYNRDPVIVPRKKHGKEAQHQEGKIAIYTARAMRVIVESGLKDEMSAGNAEIVARRAAKVALQLGIEEISEDLIKSLID